MLHLGKQRENVTLDSLQSDSLSLWKWDNVFTRENSNAWIKMSTGQVQAEIHSDEWGWNHEAHSIFGPSTISLCPRELLRAFRLCLLSAHLTPWQYTSSHVQIRVSEWSFACTHQSWLSHSEVHMVPCVAGVRYGHAPLHICLQSLTEQWILSSAVYSATHICYQITNVYCQFTIFLQNIIFNVHYMCKCKINCLLKKEINLWCYSCLGLSISSLMAQKISFTCSVQ